MSWACPVCSEPLILSERTLRCENNHCFDLAKEGYSNLLLANQKNSKEPGDSKVMLTSRRDFLSAGFCQPLADKSIELLRPYVLPESKILDCGCGEGYYSEQIYQALGCAIKGIDIARDGVRLAAKRFKAIAADAEFSVASSFKLPLADHQCDAIVQVFAPVSEPELLRVLKPQGVYCDVSPGPKHFTQLKQKLYRQARDHDAPPIAPGFELLSEIPVTFNIQLDNNCDLQNLLMMTPLYWKGSREAKAELMAMERFELTIDFVIRLYRPDITGNDIKLKKVRAWGE